jgi:mgtE-like transporter
LGNREILRQSLPLILLCGFGELIAGAMLGSMAGTLERLPGLLVLIPAIVGLKGNIDTTLGARLGSAAHMGLIETKTGWLKNTEMRSNLKAALILSFTMSFASGLLAHLTCLALGLPSAGPLALAFIAIIAGTCSGVFLAFLTAGIVVTAFRKGIDPDNVTGPALSTLGDIITFIFLLIAAELVFTLGVA